MAEGEATPHPHKARRESLGLVERDVAGLIGWSVNKIKDYEAGKLVLSPAEEQRVSIAIDSLASKQARKKASHG